MEPIKDQITDLLNGLGATSTEVAQALANKGIKGRVGEPMMCPIAELLNQQFPGWEAVVYNDSILMRMYEPSIGFWERREVLNSGTIQNFITDMDTGQFPDLVADEDLFIDTGEGLDV